MKTALLLSMVGPSEILVILIIVLLFFGGKKIPELMRGLGKGLKEFKDASQGLTEDESNKAKKNEQKED